VNHERSFSASDPAADRREGEPVRLGFCRPLLAAAALVAALMAPIVWSQDTVSYSFVYLGCNRLQPSDWQTMQATNPSSANVPQLQQTLADLAGLNPLPQLFFFVGDLVLNLEPDDGTITSISCC
jgi:hypothetical protein